MTLVMWLGSPLLENVTAVLYFLSGYGKNRARKYNEAELRTCRASPNTHETNRSRPEAPPFARNFLSSVWGRSRPFPVQADTAVALARPHNEHIMWGKDGSGPPGKPPQLLMSE